ncbi:S8 family peptidase [bacterium]|nr:S8 family peptidase [bacterium]
MKKFVIATLLLLLAVGMAYSEDVTDYAKLEQLRAEFEARYESWRGPAWEAARQATTGFYGEINANPEAELIGIDEAGNPIIYYTDNYNAGLSTRTNRVHPGGSSGFDLNGSTISRLYHWDNSTANSGHPEFSGRIVNADGGSSNQTHANHTAGTMMASGVNGSAKGMSIGATLYTNDWNNDESEMSTAGANGAKVSSHSYHSGSGYGGYLQRARDYDLVANAAPYYLIFLSAGNAGSGWDSINSSNSAKNAVVCGAANDVPNYTGPNSVSIASFSSVGPCDDDRIKPDIVGNGVDVYSCSYSSYTTMSGTSMSTPNCSGSAFLIYEQYYQTHSNTYPWASTVKAAIIHTALECGSWDGPDYRFGWGLMDTEGACELVEYDGTIDDGAISERYLINNQTYEEVLNATGDEPMRVTIVWNDPAAPANAGTTLINDLDIRLTNLNTNEVEMPWVLNGSTSNPASQGDNTADNVEQIYIEAPTAGTPYQLVVSHKNSLQGVDQAYSLIITGATTGELPEATLALNPVFWYIAPQGGPLRYNVDFSYYGDNPVPGSSYWVDVVLPNGNNYGPLFQYNFTLQPGQTISTTLTHQIPGYAPTGNYDIIGKVGTYPGTVIVSDQFEMIKLGNGTDQGDGSWPEDAEVMTTGSFEQLPDTYQLSSVYPNPFNPTTSFSLQLPEAAQVSIQVYNVRGQLVSTIADGQISAGNHQFTFDGANLSAGVYFLRASVPGQMNEFRKMALVK